MSMSTDCCPRCGSIGRFTFIYPCRYRPNQHHEWHNGGDTTAAVGRDIHDERDDLRDALTTAEETVEKMMAALKEARVLLNPSILRCVNFHHFKKDQHEASVECPVEVRAFALLSSIDALLAKGGAK